MRREPKLPTFAFQWHITDECDQRCKHCYIFAEGCDNLVSMSWDDMLDTLQKCQDMCDHAGREPYFYVTGGDPLLHPDFWRLAEELHDRDVLWAVMGNPFHVTPEVAERLESLGCRKYQVSLDGMEATHDFFRKPGSFAATLGALDTLSAAGIWTAVMTTVSNKNMDEIPELIDLAAEHGVDVYAFSRYCPTSGEKAEGWYMEPLAYRAMLVECQRRIDAHAAAGCKTTFQKKDHLWTLLDYETGRFEIPASAGEGMVYDGCHCGIGHLTITPDGTMYGCRRMNSVVGDIRERTPEEVFFGPEMEALRDFDKFEKCSKCELLGWCRGCPAVAKGTHGSMYAPDPQCWKEIA